MTLLMGRFLQASSVLTCCVHNASVELQGQHMSLPLRAAATHDKENTRWKQEALEMRFTYPLKRVKLEDSFLFSQSEPVALRTTGTARVQLGFYVKAIFSARTHSFHKCPMNPNARMQACSKF